MFICRHHLLRSYHLKYPTITVSYELSILERHHSLYCQRHVCRRLFSKGRRDEEGADVAESTTDDSEGQTTADVTSTSDLAINPNTFMGSMPKPHTWRKQPISAFFELRNEDKTKISDVSVKDIKRFIQVAIHRKRADYIDYVTKDIVRYYTREGRLELLTALLAISGLHEDQLLRKDKLLMLVQALQESNHLVHIPRQVLIMAATSTILSAADPALDIPLISALSPFLVEYASHPEQNGDTRHRLPHHPVANLLVFVQRLITLGQRQVALRLLKQLMHHGFISARASSVDLHSTNFDDIVTSVLVNSCLERHWLPQAMVLLMEVLNRGDVEQVGTSHTVFRVLAHLLQSLHGGNLEAAAAIITRVVSSPEMLPDVQEMLDRVLAAFYEQAWKSKEGPLMESIYGLTKTSDVSERYTYAAPSGHALLWLFNHLTQKSRNFGLARLLAQQIVDHDVDIPYFDRPLLIASLASAGFAGPARILWERLTTRKGAQIVLGNAGTMLRLLNLFLGLARRIPRQSSSESGLREDSEPFRRGKPLSQHELREYTKIFTETLVNRHLRPLNKQSGTHGEVASAAENSNRHFELLERHIHSIPASPPRSSPDTFNPTLQSSEERIQDLRAFAYRVMLAYCKAKRPLHSASHFDLNALARAYFLIEEYSAGFDVLMTLVFYRKESPDIQDVNVALSAIAALNSVQGAAMLDRMSEVGLKPDAVSFGTVIHHAIVQNDIPLVTTLLTRAREQNITQLSFMTIGSLIRNSTTGSGTNSPQEDLVVVDNLVDSLLDAGSILTPRMGMDCVKAALRADDPVMAFRFWKLFIKDKIDWHGDKQVYSRRCIAERIRRHCLRDTLDWRKGRVMLAELGDNVKRQPT